MKEIIENIRQLLNEGLFCDEQHVRFSLVGRICYALGWDIWNPAEFFTEYKVKRLPQQNISKEVSGRVDIALFNPEKSSEGAEVFIEVKAPGKLDSDLIAGETQLHLYNAYHKSAISILTDGIKWRFYLPSAGGEFENKLFNELNLLEDDPEEIAQAFTLILKKDNYRKKALDTAEEMRVELTRIRLINKVKDEATLIHEKTNFSLYEIAQGIIETNYKTKIELNEIKRLWDRKQAGIQEVQDYVPAEYVESEVSVDIPENYSFCKPRYIILNGSHIDVKYWFEIKKAVYNYLIKHKPKLVLDGSLKYSRDKTDYREPISLEGGYFTEGNLDSNNMVKRCRAAMKKAGFDPIKDLVIAIEHKPKKQ